jgi:hypothetical protein
MARHLKNRHRQRPAHESSTNGNQSIVSMLQQLRPPWSQAVSDKMLARLIVHENLSFRIVESPYFREYVQYQRNTNHIPNSADSARDWIVTGYEEAKSKVRELLAGALTSIHLSIDAWTTPQLTMAILGIVAHFVGADRKLYGVVIGFEELDGPHSGMNMAEYVYKVVEDYGITNSLGYLVMDNATSNDTLVHALEKRLVLSHWRSEDHRLRCFGHILNLSVRAFWFGERGSKTRQQGIYEMIVVDEEKEEADEFATWRKIGPWGKIHNICCYIRSSTERKERFRKAGAQKMVTEENATRWNTGYTMLKTALELQDHLEIFCNRHPDLKNDVLNEKEWQQLAAVLEILKPFFDATKRMERRTITIAEVIPRLDFLTSKYRLVISSYAAEKDIHIVQAANLGLAKLEKYFTMIRKTPAYIAAVILDPSTKMEFFESSSWTVKSIQKAKDLVVHLWETEYKGQEGTQISIARDTEIEEEECMEWRMKRRRISKGDQLEQYLAVPIEDGSVEYVEWWCHKKAIWPQLSKMALDILSIPSMSADAERLFSSGKMVLRDSRSRLSSMVALECLKSWEREGIVQSPIG